MFQPFEPFREEFLEQLIKLKKTHLVSQSYARGNGDVNGFSKTVLLLSDYDDPGLAKVHWNAVRHDKYAAIINLEKPAHYEKIKEMLGAGSTYLLYWAIVKSRKEMETRINARYMDHLRRYIQTHTNWRIGRDTTIRPSIQLIFGEIYIVLKYTGQTLRIKFEDIEKA